MAVLRATGDFQQVEVAFFDTHLHGREGKVLIIVAHDVIERSSGGILMPNLQQQLTTTAGVQAYLALWGVHAKRGAWVATIYLTTATMPEEVKKAFRMRLIAGVKWYPPGHQQSDKNVTAEMLVTRSGKTGEMLSMMEEEGIPLLVHGEVGHDMDGNELDPYDKEAYFVKFYLPLLRKSYPKLRISLEHISSEEAVEYMIEHGDPYYMVCTITAHHLALDRRYLYLNGFLRPHHHCLPVIKTVKHKSALHRLLEGRRAFVMAGTDLAPHDRDERKHNYCCWGGLYTGHCSVELYLQVLEGLGLLDYAEQFFCGNAKKFYGDLIPDHPQKFLFEKKGWTVNEPIIYDASGGPDKEKVVVPFGYQPNEHDRWPFTWQLVRAA